MPILLSTDELRAKMKLYRPLSESGTVLLPAGATLSGRDIAALRQKRPHAQVEVCDDELDEAVEFADTSANRAIAAKVKKTLVKSLTNVRSSYVSHLKMDNREVRGLAEAVSAVVQFLHENPVSAAVLSKHSSADHYLVEHPANVFYLALVLGNAVKGYVQQENARKAASAGGMADPTELDLTALGLAALYQDLSLWPLQELYHTGAPMSSDQRRIVREHPLVSAENIPGDAPRLTREVVQAHHENYDGTGYPHRLSADEPHLFARMLRICDAFDAATATTVYSQARSPARVLAEMTRGPYRRYYDPILLKLFSNVIQPFPIGAKVQLSDGRFAVVVKYSRRDPFAPVVVVAFDRSGERLPPGRLAGPIALDRMPELRISSFRGEDMATPCHCPSQAADSLTITEFNTLFDSAYP